MPLAAFVNTPDACTLVNVAEAVNVFAKVYVDVAALSESLVGVNVPACLLRPPVVISPRCQSAMAHASSPIVSTTVTSACRIRSRSR